MLKLINPRCALRVALPALLAALLAQSAAAESSTYQYDPLGRVTQQTDWDGTVITFAYDPAGNRTQRVITVGTEHRPAAVTDALTVTGTTPGSLDPRTNDSDPDSDPLTVAGATNGAHGTTTFTTTSVTYTAASGYSGADAFAYTLSDGHGGTASAKVNVTVNPSPNPIAVNDNLVIHTYIDPMRGPITKGCLYPLSNDSDPNGYALSITGYGTPTHSPDTVFITPGDPTNVCYYGSSGSTYTSTFTYTISNGHGGVATGTVYVSVYPS